MRDEGSDADDRVIDVLRKFIADRLAGLYVGFADEVVGGREAAFAPKPEASIWEDRSS